VAFAAFAGWVAYAAIGSLYRTIRSYSFESVPCIIDASALERRAEGSAEEPYRFTVRYRYVVGGQEYHGERYRPGYYGSSDLAATQRLAARYAPGSGASCWVDPEDPSWATLERAGWLESVLVLLGALVVLAGAVGGIVWLWRRRRGRPAEGGGGGVESISSRARSGGKGCLIGFFLLFAGFGLLFLIPFFVKPAVQVLAARDWQAVPCVVLESSVASHQGDDSTTYSVEVLYEYEVDGQTIQGDRYQFMGGSSSGYEAKAEVVAALPAGAETTCYVNPEDPFDSVMERGFTGSFLFGLIPLVFIVVGVGGAAAVGIAGSKKASRRRRASAEPGRIREEISTGGATTLEPKAGPVGRLLVVILITAFWNGIVSIFVWQLVKGWNQGSPDGCLALFLVPFVLIGLLLLTAVPYQFLALFNPRPRVTVSRSSLPLGEAAQLSWSFAGSPRRIRRLTLTVEGREEATYRQGTNTRTAKETFYSATLLETENRMEIPGGTVQLVLPEDTMHSFTASHNKIVWTLKLAGDIRLWPDVGEELQLDVAPGRGRAS
jgi:hypothetical protein